MPNNNYLQKNIQSKSCRQLSRFSIERRAGRGSIAYGCCGGVFSGVIVSEKPSSSSIVIGFSADPASYQGKRKSSTG